MKKIATLALGTGVVTMSLTGCFGGGSDKASANYEVKGTVDQQWIDYECSKASGTLNIDPVAYVAGKTSGGTGSGKKADTDTGSGAGKVDTGKTGTSSSGSSGGSTSTATPRSSNPTPRGTSTPTATPSPLKVTKVPTGKPKKPKGFDSKWCTSEYELFIKNGDGVFDQDVEKSVWDACSKDEKFPSCAK